MMVQDTHALVHSPSSKIMQLIVLNSRETQDHATTDLEDGAGMDISAAGFWDSHH